METQTKRKLGDWYWVQGLDMPEPTPARWMGSFWRMGTHDFTDDAEGVIGCELIPQPSWIMNAQGQVTPLQIAVTMRSEDIAAIKEERSQLHSQPPEDVPEIIETPSPTEVIQKLFNLFDEPPEGLTMEQIAGAWEWVKYAKHVMEHENDLSNIRTEALKIELAKREPPPDDPEQAAAFCSFCDKKGHTRDRCPNLAAAPRGAAPLIAEIPNCQHIRVVGRQSQVTCKRCGADLSKTAPANRFGF